MSRYRVLNQWSQHCCIAVQSSIHPGLLIRSVLIEARIYNLISIRTMPSFLTGLALVTRRWLLCIRKSASLSSFAIFCSKWPSFPSSYYSSHSFRTPEYEKGKEGHLEQKRAKEDSDALFLIQRSHFLVTSVLSDWSILYTCINKPSG